MHIVMPILTSKGPKGFTINTYQRTTDRSQRLSRLSKRHNDDEKDDVKEFDRNRLLATTTTTVVSLFHLQKGTGTGAKEPEHDSTIKDSRRTTKNVVTNIIVRGASTKRQSRSSQHSMRLVYGCNNKRNNNNNKKKNSCNSNCNSIHNSIIVVLLFVLVSIMIIIVVIHSRTHGAVSLLLSLLLFAAVSSAGKRGKKQHHCPVSGIRYPASWFVVCGPVLLPLLLYCCCCCYF